MTEDSLGMKVQYLPVLETQSIHSRKWQLCKFNFFKHSKLLLELLLLYGSILTLVAFFFSRCHLYALMYKTLHFERWRLSEYILFQLPSWKGTNMMLCFKIQSIPIESKAASSHQQVSHGFVPHQSQDVLGKKRYLAIEVFLAFQPWE